MLLVNLFACTFVTLVCYVLASFTRPSFFFSWLVKAAAAEDRAAAEQERAAAEQARKAAQDVEDANRSKAIEERAATIETTAMASAHRVRAEGLAAREEAGRLEAAATVSCLAVG